MRLMLEKFHFEDGAHLTAVDDKSGQKAELVLKRDELEKLQQMVRIALEPAGVEMRLELPDRK